jgi:hypothetical protein
MMKKLLLLGMIVALCSFTMHKFYMSVTQIQHHAGINELQITSRYFVDDLNTELEKIHKRKFYLGSSKETKEDVAQMQQYILDHFSLKIDGKKLTLQWLHNQLEDDVMLCYLLVSNVKKVTSIEVTNTCLFGQLPDQQNMVHVEVQGKKKTALLTKDKFTEVLKY